MSFSPIQFITQTTERFSDVELTRFACRAGIGWVQVRVKNASYPEWLRVASEVKQECDAFDAVCIVNDNVRIAKEIGAHGVHLGKQDMSPSVARQILGDGCIIGGTANTVQDITRLVDEGVDYIGLGPFRFTKTKQELSPVLGIEGVQEVLQSRGEEASRVPLVAIGGIELGDIPSLFELGVSGVALSSAISKSESPQVAAQEVCALTYSSVDQSSRGKYAYG